MVPFLSNRALEDAVRQLRARGVRFPKKYPPANLDPGGPQFRGVMAEIETLVLLSRVIEPELLESAEAAADGDTDIIIHLSPPYRLQVKGPMTISVRADYTISEMVRTARNDALSRFRKDYHTPWKGVFSSITIRPGGTTEQYSGSSYSVDHPRRVHAAVVLIESGVLSAMASKNLDRWIRTAVGQMSAYSDALLVPVLNLSRYSLDQRNAYKLARATFRRHPRWRSQVAGVILVLPGYGDRDPDTGFHRTKLRLIGIANPLAPKERRLNPALFNPGVENESVFEEDPVVISIEPPEPWRVENGLLWVGETLFGPLPKPLSEPFMGTP